MNATRASVIVLLLVTNVAACRRDGVVKTPNRSPEAKARISAIGGEPVEDFTNAAGEIAVPFDGSPVEVTLDASESKDKEGPIATYRWLSGTLAMDGMGRLVPEGEANDWPEDEIETTVMLPEGRWSFVLWVIDEGGVVSEPDSVELVVGDPPEPMPPPEMPGEEDAGGGGPVDPAAVAMCVAGVAASVVEPCKQCLCSIDETCSAAVLESACNEACWTLIRCVGKNCPDFAATMDVSCLITNCMAELNAGMAGATAAGTCATMCRDVCPSE